jgi:hypothetical protein
MRRSVADLGLAIVVGSLGAIHIPEIAVTMAFFGAVLALTAK